MTLSGKWSRLRFWKTDEWKKLKDIEGVPAPHLRLRALELTPYEDLLVVILGQDPYHNRDHANGLGFSVYPHVKRLPGSLNNIFTEYRSDLGYNYPRNGDLTEWANRGILLINSALSVGEGSANSHRGIGWEKLTYEVLRTVNDKEQPVVVILWGKQAGEYRAIINNPKHLVLTSPHPSPLSARTGFFGSKPFSKTCDFLKVDKTLWKLT